MTPKAKARRGRKKVRAGATNVVPVSEGDAAAVLKLIKQQKRRGTVEEWLSGYTKELHEVKSRRLRLVEDPEGLQVAEGEAIRLSLEEKSDGSSYSRDRTNVLATCIL